VCVLTASNSRAFDGFTIAFPATVTGGRVVRCVIASDPGHASGDGRAAPRSHSEG
jgi:hypothetical protein